MTPARCHTARADKRGRGWKVRSRRGVTRRGFSILELLVVLALVLAILSLAMPSLANWMTAGLRESREQFSSAAMIARGTARERGITVELWGEGEGARRLVVRRSQPADVSEAIDAARPVLGPVLERLDELPGGVQIQTTIEGVLESPAKDPTADETPGVLLATFWAGGGCELNGEWRLLAQGETYRPAFNTWTGALSFELVEPAEGPDDSAEPSEPSAPADASDPIPEDNP